MLGGAAGGHRTRQSRMSVAANVLKLLSMFSPFSIAHAQSELEVARPGIDCAAHLTEARIVDVGVGAPELSAVEQVEEFAAELETEFLAQQPILAEREIEVVRVIGADVAEPARRVAEGEIRRQAEHRGVKPAVDLLRARPVEVGLPTPGGLDVRHVRMLR